jgi:hypothetical protein
MGSSGAVDAPIQRELEAVGVVALVAMTTALRAP